MKTKILLFIIAITSSCLARIGETPQECLARYGKPVSFDESKSQAIFNKSGLIIVVQYFQGKADTIVFRKAETDVLGHGVEFSDTEIELLLNANSGGLKWTQRKIISMSKEWYTEGQTIWANYDPIQNMLFILTKEAMQRSTDEQKKSEQKKLEGL